MHSDTGLWLLLEQAKLGDQDAMRVLMARYRATIAREVDNFKDSLSPFLSSQDLYQEVWLRVWSRLPGFEGSQDDATTRAMFIKWLKVTTRNVSLNILEKGNAQKRRPTKTDGVLDGVELPDQGKSPSSIVRADESRSVLQQAIHELGDDESAEILRLRFFEGLTLKTVAAKLMTSEDNVRYRLRRILSQLEGRLNCWNDLEQ